MSRRLRALLPELAALAGVLAAAPAQASGEELNIIPDPQRVVVLLVAFTVLVPVLDRLLFRPLLGVLAERDLRINGARTRAAELARDAGDLLARHDAALREARDSANVARTQQVEEARRAQHAAVSEARGEAERRIVATRGDVAAAVDRARSGLAAEAQPLAREVAERLLGRSLS